MFNFKFELNGTEGKIEAERTRDKGRKIDSEKKRKRIREKDRGRERWRLNHCRRESDWERER